MKQDLEELLEVWPLAKDFNLQPNAIVVVAGCYTGKVMDLINTMYPESIIHGFDPQAWAIDQAQARFNGRPKNIHFHPYALGVEQAEITMYDYETDACSTDLAYGKPTFVGEFRNFENVMRNISTDPVYKNGYVDLFIMNMEGYEFTLLPYLLDRDWMSYIDNIAIQWHLHGRPDSEMNNLISAIESEFHTTAYDHRPQWTYHTAI